MIEHLGTHIDAPDHVLRTDNEKVDTIENVRLMLCITINNIQFFYFIGAVFIY